MLTSFASLVRDMTPALAITVLGLVGALAISIPSTPSPRVIENAPDRRMVAALFPVWWSAERSFAAAAAAGLPIVRTGGWDPVVILVSPTADSDARLLATGAWLLLDPLSAAGCLLRAVDGRAAHREG